MDPLIPLCLRSVRRWTADLPPPGEPDLSCLASLLLRVPVSTLERFIRSNAGPVEGTSASPPPPPTTTTGPALLAFVLHLALRRARQRALEATSDVLDLQLQGDLLDSTLLHPLRQRQATPGFLPRIHAWIQPQPDIDSVRLLLRLLLRTPTPLAAPTPTTASIGMPPPQELRFASHIEGSPISNRMIRSILLAWHSSRVASREEMFIVWASLQTLRYVLSCIPHQDSAVTKQDVSHGQMIYSKDQEDVTDGLLFSSKGRRQMIITNIAEAQDVITQWEASHADLVVDVPMDISLDTFNDVMACFSNHGASALLCGPNVTTLLKGAQDFIGYLG